LGRRVNQIGNPLGLRQIESAVEKCALGIFPGLRNPRAQLQTPGQQHLYHHGPAMALEFDNIFARVGLGRRKKQRDTLINGYVIRIAKTGEGCAPRNKLYINQAGEQGT
jgi:hypothetical protein